MIKHKNEPPLQQRRLAPGIGEGETAVAQQIINSEWGVGNAKRP
jgi:hypothetical protein